MASLPIYPDQVVLPGLTFHTTWSPQFYNMPTDTTETGADIDLALAEYPLHNFTLSYEFLRNQAYAPVHARSLFSSLEFQTLMGFHLQLRGSVGRFLFNNVDDFSVNQQHVAVGDGTKTNFTLVRTYGAGGYSGTEPIGVVNTSQPFNVYINGSSFPVNPALYTIDVSVPVNQQLVFVTPPVLGTSIAVDMMYWYYCKFPNNSATFEKFMQNLWLLNEVKIHSCRSGA